MALDSATVLIDRYGVDIVIQSQSVQNIGMNLSIPQQNTQNYKATVITKKQNSYKQLSFNDDIPITHKFIIKYTSNDIKVKDLIKYDSRSFEIQTINNPNELNIILELSATEIIEHEATNANP